MRRLAVAATIALTLTLHATPAHAAEGRAAVLAPKVQGVAVPPLLTRIRWCESRNNYRAQNRRSTASGAYQMLRGTWRSWSRAYGADVGAGRYRAAKDAPPHVQDVVAVRAFRAQGTRPWNASKRCWR